MKKTLAFIDGLEELSIEEVLERFEPLAISHAHKNINLFEFDDAYQIARMTICKAYNKYTLIEHGNGHNSSFPAYIKTCITNTFSKKNRDLNNIQRRIPSSQIEYIDPANPTHCDKSYDSYDFIQDDYLESIITDLSKDSITAKCILMKNNEYTSKEIATILEVTESFVNGRIDRFRKKNKKQRDIILNKYMVGELC